MKTQLALLQLLILNLSIFLHNVVSPSPTIIPPPFSLSAYMCGRLITDGNYTNNSTYKSNLHTLLSTITSNPNNEYGFYNISAGQDLDIVHGLALCRGDVSMARCHSCITSATAKITQDCPNQKDASGWYDDCMISFSNVNILNGEFSFPHYNKTDLKGIGHKRFNRTVEPWLRKLASEAASGDSRLKFSTGEIDVRTVSNGSHKMYAVAQCTPNLEDFDCLNCLENLINDTLARCCYASLGAFAGAPSCNIRYENYRFYGSARVLPPLQPLPFSPAPAPFSIRHSRGIRKRYRVLISILVPVFTCLVLLLTCFILKNKSKGSKNAENGDGDEIQTIQSLKMKYAAVRAATDNFSDANILGRDGSGTVYKGTLSTGQVKAVKRVAKNSGQTEKEFKNEALLVGKLQHRNLVRLFGFCIQKDERLFVYEYLPNKTLDCLLFDPNEPICLDWQNRYKIIEGIARGLLYLHEESRLLVVHRDLKASNVLLDSEMNPKISDFGMARLFGADRSHASTSKIVGTYGYMPPEYVLHGQFSIKSDVFSFGVLVLEIISGRNVTKFSEVENGENLLSCAWKYWSEGNALNLVDSRLSIVDTTEVLRCIHIGLLCVQENAAQRPIMSSVVLMLSSYSVTLPMPSRPAFLMMDSDPTSLEHKKEPLTESINDASISELFPR